MTVYSRLKELRKNAKLSQKQVAEKLGIRYQVYQRWENGKVEIRDKKDLDRLAKIFNTTVEYITDTEILPKYQQLDNHRKEIAINFVSNQLEEQQKETKVIHFRNTLIPYQVEEEQALSAGNGEGYTSSQNIETVYWDQDIAYDKAVWIKGDSMEPDFHYGEVALIKYQNYLDFPGQICAVDDVERGQAYIKSVRIEDKYLVLHSLNDSIDGDGNLIFPDKYIPLSENPRIIGKVVDHFTPIEK